MKKIIISIILFAVAIGLVIGIIIPLTEHCRETGLTSITRGESIGNSLKNILK